MHCSHRCRELLPSALYERKKQIMLLRNGYCLLRETSKVQLLTGKLLEIRVTRALVAKSGNPQPVTKMHGIRLLFNTQHVTCKSNEK
jgi:hypothetical protein